MSRCIDVDNFAGGGGASLGIEQALGKAVDVAINHDAEALAMHRANHPDTTHFNQNIWAVDPAEVVAEHGPVRLAWFSPDCTHFSKARGGKPLRDGSNRSRDLAWVVVYWARTARPQIIFLENVEEFADWGPLGKNGRPCPKSKGETFRKWIRAIKAAGYRVEWRELRGCDYGAPTIRKRLFLIARRDGHPITWPAPTHGPGLVPFRTAAQCIDWDIPVHSIFLSPDEARKVGVRRPLAEATMTRIARGVWKYVINARRPFIAPLTRQGAARVHPTDEPPRAVTCARRGEPSLVSAFLAQHNTGVTGHPATVPVSTIVGKGSTQNLVLAHMTRQFGNSVGQSADAPAPTTTAGGGGKSGLVTAHLMARFTGNTAGGEGDIRRPLRTVRAHGRHHSMVHAFMVKYYGEGGQLAGLNDPAPTATTRARLGLITVNGIDYRIVDIGMRMLTPRELFRAQGFPDSYVIAPELNGKALTKTAQIRMCGNSVCPQVVRDLVAANVVGVHARAA